MHEVDPRILIIKMCDINKIDVLDEIVEKVARKLDKKDKDLYDFNDYFGQEQN